MDDIVRSPSVYEEKNHPSSSFQVLFQCLPLFTGIENWVRYFWFLMERFLTIHPKYLQLGLIIDVIVNFMFVT